MKVFKNKKTDSPKLLSSLICNCAKDTSNSHYSTQIIEIKNLSACKLLYRCRENSPYPKAIKKTKIQQNKDKKEIKHNKQR